MERTSSPQKWPTCIWWLLLNSTEFLTEKFTKVVLQNYKQPTLQSPLWSKERKYKSSSQHFGHVRYLQKRHLYVLATSHFFSGIDYPLNAKNTLVLRQIFPFLPATYSPNNNSDPFYSAFVEIRDLTIPQRRSQWLRDFWLHALPNVFALISSHQLIQSSEVI